MCSSATVMNSDEQQGDSSSSCSMSGGGGSAPVSRHASGQHLVRRCHPRPPPTPPGLEQAVLSWRAGLFMGCSDVSLSTLAVRYMYPHLSTRYAHPPPMLDCTCWSECVCRCMSTIHAGAANPRHDMLCYLCPLCKVMCMRCSHACCLCMHVLAPLLLGFTAFGVLACNW